MNKIFSALLAGLLVADPLFSADLFTSYFNRRFNAPQMQVRDVEGLDKRIVDGKLHLHLRDFLELMLKNEASIQLARMDVYTSADRIVGAKTPFDPTVSAGFTTLRSLSPPLYFASTIPTSNGGLGNSSGLGSGGSGSSGLFTPQTINSLTQQSTLTYTQLLPTGQTITGSFVVDRSSGDGYSSPALFGDLSFAITQPLLQNRTNVQNRAPITVARTQLLITSETSEATIGTNVAAAARQYWEAILARDNIRVQGQTLNLAQKSYERDKKALDLGAIAKLDIYQSQTQMAERNRDLVQARYQYTAALDGLRQLIGADLTPALRNTEIILEDDPAAIPPRSAILPFEDALAKALQVRPESKAAGQRITVDELNARLSRDSLLPKLDLTLNGGASGPGFNTPAANSNTIVYPGLGQTLQQVLAFNFPSYGFGLQMTFPLRNSTAQANLSDALVSKAHDRYQQRQIQEQITFDVRQAINSIELASATIEAAILARDLALKNVAAEQQKYELGTITAFELLDSQSRLASAESALLNAYVTYQEAYINYQHATWTLFDGLGMVVETPRVK